MSDFRLEFYDRNATRAWPLDDAASATDDAGNSLPQNILVDAQLRFPRSLGQYLYLAGLTVTPNIVTLVLAATDDPATVAQPVGQFFPAAMLNLAQPVAVGVPVAVEAVAPGVAGWVVFGPGIQTPYAGKFTDASQGQLLARCASSYRTAASDPFHTLGPAQGAAAPQLTGVVNLVAGGDLTFVVEEISVPTVGNVSALVIKLDDSPANLAAGIDVYATYAGPCGARQEAGTCPVPGVQTIDGVTPDCLGRIEIEFRGIEVAPSHCGYGAVVLDLGVGLAAVCGTRDWSLDAVSYASCHSHFSEEPISESSIGESLVISSSLGLD